MSAKTLKEIAKELNISRFTVSRVIRNDKYVSDETRKLVLDYLKKEPYFPNTHSKILFSGKVPVIGLVFPSEATVMLEFYAQEIIKGASIAVKEKDFHLMLFAQDTFNYQECIRLYRSKLVGGFVLSGIGKNNFSDIRQLKKEKIPQVLLCSHLKGIPSFDCDNVEGGYLAVKHLIKTGRGRIAFMHGHRNWVDVSDRCKGYKKALTENKIDVDPNYIKYSRKIIDLQFEKNAVRELLALKKSPDAIFAASDRMAIATIMSLKENGKKVPKDVAVIGFDNISTSENLNPALSTVEQPIESMAYIATKNLIQMILTGKIISKSQLFKPTLILRKST